MINQADISKALGVKIPVSSKMRTALSEWEDLYTNESSWIKEDTISLELASEISSETARLITNNGKSWISGSQRADYLQEQYSGYMSRIRRDVEFACALGGIILKPYLSGKRIKVDSVTADRFLPVSFDSDGEITAAVFQERYTIGNEYYTRLEYHSLDVSRGIYTTVNRAFSSKDRYSLGKECSLKSVPLWSDHTEEIIIRDVERPLFAYYRMPAANNIDMGSPLGMSCYKKAAEEIRQADQHWERIMWEYQGSELAVMAQQSMFRVEKGKAAIPKGKHRLFDVLQGGDENFFKEFSPTIRDQSLFNGLNRILQRIEFNCDLAYGTISDPQTVEKTAEEVRSGKERSRSSMSEKQKALESALKHLIWIFNEYADYYRLAPPGKYETAFEWGEGVSVDRDKEFSRQLQLVTAGKLKAEKLLAWYFGCSEDKAKEYMPDAAPLFGGGL